MNDRAPFRVGVDIGGTFTDIVVLRPDGRLDKLKVPSTPGDYSQAIIDGMSAYCHEHGNGIRATSLLTASSS